MRTVLCFGDSNTHGTVPMRDMTDRRRFAKAQRWPSIMAAALGDGFEVIAEGHGGRTAVFDDPVERDAVFASMHRSVMGGGTEACTIGEALAVLSLAECLRGE